MPSGHIFADLLTEALWQIKRRDKTSLAVIQDELGYAIGRNHGGSVIEYWRKGHLPTNIVELEALCLELHRRLNPSSAWLEQFLTAARHPYPEGFLKTLFPLPATPATEFRTRPPLRDFIGREAERQHLAAILQTSAHQSPIIVIRGMGGIGKTELAYSIIDEVRCQYPDGSIFVPIQATAGAGQTANDVLRHILQLCSPTHRLPDTDDEHTLQTHYQALLAHKRLIIVLDDAETTDVIGPLIPPAGSALIVTTRRRMSLPGMHVLDIDVLPPDAATRLITTICPRIGDHAGALAAHCGYLPLALRMSASFLANDDTYPIPLYLEHLAQERLRLELLRDPDNPNLDVAASLALSIERLDPAVQAALCCLGVFATSFSDDAAAAVIGTTAPQQIRHIIGQLRRQHLINYDPHTRQYHLHDLVRVLVWQHVPDPDAVWLRYVDYTIHCLRVIHQHYNAAGNATLTAFADFGREIGHARTIWAWLVAQPPTSAIDDLIIQYGSTTTMFGRIYFATRRERIPQLQRIIWAAQRRQHRRAETASLGNLVAAYYDMGDIPSASAVLEQATNRADELQDGYFQIHMLQFSVLILMAQAKFQQAEVELRRLDVMSHIVDNSVMKAMSASLLGKLLWRRGNLLEAIPHLLAAQSIERTHGYTYASLRTSQYLASVYADAGDLFHAQSILDEALITARDLGDDASEAMLLRTLAEVVFRQDRGLKAFELIEQAMALIQEDHSLAIFLAIRGTYALIAYGCGFKDRGRAAFKDLEERTPEQEDPWVLAMVGWKFGQLLVQDGNYSEGLRAMQYWIDYQQTIDHALRDTHEALFVRLQAAYQATR